MLRNLSTGSVTTNELRASVHATLFVGWLWIKQRPIYFQTTQMVTISVIFTILES